VASTENIADIIFRHRVIDDGFTAGMKAASEASLSAARAAEQVSEAEGKVTREVGRAAPAWSAVNKLVDENAKLSAAVERADRQLEARKQSLRQAAAKDADVAKGQAEIEQKLITLRNESVRKAEETAARERTRWQAVSEGTSNASAGMANLSHVATSAGQQLQDVAVQAQSGANAFTIIAEQGSQFLSQFGTAGAVAGAALALGAIALQAAGLAGETKSLNDVLKEQDEQYTRLNSEAKERVSGLASEAEAVQTLRNEYTAMGREQARAESIRLTRAQRTLNDQQGTLLETLGGRLAPNLRQQENAGLPVLTNFEDVTGIGNQAQRFAPDLTAGVAAFKALRDAGDLTVTSLRSYITALDDAAKAGGGNADAIKRLRDAAVDALPSVAQLEEGQRKNAVQAVALRLAAGETADALIAAGNKAQGAGGGFSSLSADIVRAAEALDRLRRTTVDDPLRDVNASMSRTADLTAALRSGGVAVYERVKDAQDAAAASQATLTKKVEEYIKARAPEVGAAQAEEEAAAKRAGWALDIQRAADAEKALNRELDATKKAEAEAEAAAKRRATAAATAAKQAEEKTNKNALALQASFDDFWEKAEGRAEERAGKTADAANKAMAKGLVELEQENSKQRAQEANNATDRIVRYAGSAFADMFRDGKKNWSEMWANFFGVARATLARIVAEAALRPIIQPIVLSVMGGDSGGAIVSSALGSGGGITQSTGGGGMFSGLTGSIGQSVAGKWVADQLGISGMSLGQIGSSLGITSSATAAPSLAGMSTSEALASLPATPTAASTGTGIYALGPVGGIAGGVGLGMLGGSIVGGMRGSVDASRNSAIGGMIGAGVGAFFGPVGSLVGGALGGAVGGLFGPTKKGMEERSGGNVIWGIGENGQLSITSAQGKRWDQAGATSETQGKLDAINAAAAARGLTFGGNLTTQQRNIGFGEGAARAGWSNALNEAAVVGLLQSGNTNVQTALNASRSGTLEQALSNVDFVTQVYEPLQKTGGATKQFQAQLEALQNVFKPAIDRAAGLGLATEGLSDAWSKAIATAGEARNAAVNVATDSLTARMLRAQGRGAEADWIGLDSAESQQRQAWKAQLDEWGLDATQVAERMVILEKTLGAERLKAQEAANDAITDRVRTVQLSGAGLRSRYQRATGDDLGASLTEFDANAATQRVSLQRTLRDSLADVTETAAQMGMLETDLGLERVKIVADYNKKIADAEQQALETRAGKAADIIGGLTKYAQSLRTGADSPLSATQRYWQASQAFQRTLDQAQGGNATAMAGLSSAADTFLGASRNIYGSGSSYAQDWNRVVTAIASIAAKSPDELTAAVFQDETRSQTAVLKDSIDALRTEVAGLRTETRLANSSPARAA
jgi:hypothetical protein